MLFSVIAAIAILASYVILGSVVYCLMDRFIVRDNIELETINEAATILWPVLVPVLLVTILSVRWGAMLVVKFNEILDRLCEGDVSK